MTVKTTTGNQNLQTVHVTESYVEYKGLTTRNGTTSGVYSTGYTEADAQTGMIELLADLDGLMHCDKARANAEKATTWTIGNLPAINAAFNYNTLAIPSTSSGWYLPSMGQCYYWWEKFGNVSTLFPNHFPVNSTTIGNWAKGTDTYFFGGGSYGGSVPHQLLVAMNGYVKGKLGTSSNQSYFTPFQETGQVWDYTYNADGTKHMQDNLSFWTSTEGRFRTQVWLLRFNVAGTNGNIDLWVADGIIGKQHTSAMRPVLSF